MPRTAVLLKAVILIALASMLTLTAAGAPRLIFRSAHFMPHPVGPGESIKISAMVTIEGAPMTPTAVVEAVPSRPGPPPPIIVLGTFRPGTQMIELFRYTVPTPTPERACLNISLPGGQLRDVCFKRVKGSDGRWWMDVDSEGRWVETTPTPTVAGPAPSGSPDLVLVGNIMADSAIKLRNNGYVAATNISVRKTCLYRDRWMPVGGDAETRVLNIGEEKTLNIGKLGEGLGQCPPGSTLVRITADPANRIAELDENNNTLEGNTLPDLTVSDYKIYFRGGYRVSFTVANLGTDAGRFGWDVCVPSREGCASAMGQTISGLAAGQRLEVDVAAPAIDSYARRGGYYTTLRIDPLNQVTESNETNNKDYANANRPTT